MFLGRALAVNGTHPRVVGGGGLRPGSPVPGHNNLQSAIYNRKHPATREHGSSVTVPSGVMKKKPAVVDGSRHPQTALRFSDQCGNLPNPREQRLELKVPQLSHRPSLRSRHMRRSFFNALFFDGRVYWIIGIVAVVVGADR